MLNLDTHILLAVMEGSLTRPEQALLHRVPEWGIAAIVLWEIEMLFRAGRIAHGLDDGTMAAMLASIAVWPLDQTVALSLRQLDFQSDPADQIIAATSLARRVPLVTRDARLRNSSLLRRHGLVR